MGGSSQADDMGETTGQGNMGQGFDQNQGNLGRGFDNSGASWSKEPVYSCMLFAAALLRLSIVVRSQVSRRSSACYVADRCAVPGKRSQSRLAIYVLKIIACSLGCCKQVSCTQLQPSHLQHWVLQWSQLDQLQLALTSWWYPQLHLCEFAFQVLEAMLEAPMTLAAAATPV